jgi:hypothetical protein
LDALKTQLIAYYASFVLPIFVVVDIHKQWQNWKAEHVLWHSSLKYFSSMDYVYALIPTEDKFAPNMELKKAA